MTDEPTSSLPEHGESDAISPDSDNSSELGRSAHDLDSRPLRDRVRLSSKSLRRIFVGFLSLLALLGLIAALFWQTGPGSDALLLVFPVIVLAFVFETLDSASGMGFGTALAPLLFTLGYEPLQVVPALLVCEAVTGLVAGLMHHECENVRFSLRRPWTEATVVVAALAGVSLVASVLGIFLTYVAFSPPAALLKWYVALLVIAMGVFGLFRQFLHTSDEYRPRRLFGFAVLAGFNKGLVGGGYGPVVTLGQIFSGVHEKTATAITSMSEGLVSFAGILAYCILWATGSPVDLVLIPSILLGAIFAALLAPYLVRVFSRRVFGYLIPIYAFVVGAVALAQLIR